MVVETAGNMKEISKDVLEGVKIDVIETKKIKIVETRGEKLNGISIDAKKDVKETSLEMNVEVLN